jgi:hypothetical protein
MVPRLSTTIQYLFIGAIGYILAGAPLSRSLFSASKQDPTEGISLEKGASLVIPEDNLTCPHHAYNVHILSRDPLVIYIQSFLSNEEAEHLVRIRFEPLLILSNSNMPIVINQLIQTTAAKTSSGLPLSGLKGLRDLTLLSGNPKRLSWTEMILSNALRTVPVSSKGGAPMSS